MIRIREEKSSDQEAVRDVVCRAFASAEHSDGNESQLVDALRSDSAFVPELSLVAESDATIVGHVLLTRAFVGAQSVLALAPLSVRSDYQRQGVGSALVKEAHRIAASLGYAWSVVLGDPAYYSRFGYTNASKFGIQAPFDVPDEYFMAVKLVPDAPILSGVMRYAKAFGIN